MSKQEKIVWETDLSLFSPEMIKGWGLAMVATWLLMILIMGVIFVAQGEAEALVDMAMIFLVVVTGLWVFGLLLMVMLFRGKLRVRYTVSETGIRMETLDKVAKKTNRVAIVLGALSGKPGLLGAGLINLLRETEAVSWKGAFRAVYRPERHLIIFKGAWRNLLLVQCLANNYAQVVALIERVMDRHGTARRVPGKSPLPSYLARTALVVLASLPILALHKAYDLDVFLPLLMFCFALATVWLIPLFGWVVLGSLGLIAFTLAAHLLEETPSSIRPGQTFTLLEVMGTEDWLMLGLAGLGAVVLVWLSLGALRGHFPSALMADRHDMG